MAQTGLTLEADHDGFWRKMGGGTTPADAGDSPVHGHNRITRGEARGFSEYSDLVENVPLALSENPTPDRSCPDCYQGDQGKNLILSA